MVVNESSPRKLASYYSTTITGLSDGAHNITAYVNGTCESMTIGGAWRAVNVTAYSSTVYFVVDSPENRTIDVPITLAAASVTAIAVTTAIAGVALHKREKSPRQVKQSLDALQLKFHLPLCNPLI